MDEAREADSDGGLATDRRQTPALFPVPTTVRHSRRPRPRSSAEYRQPRQLAARKGTFAVTQRLRCRMSLMPEKSETWRDA